MKRTINRTDIRDAMIEFTELVDQTQHHIHLRISIDGSVSVDESTSYEIGCDEFEKRDGATITIKHQQGNGQCDLSDDWYLDDAENDALETSIDDLISELERREIEFTLVGSADHDGSRRRNRIRK